MKRATALARAPLLLAAGLLISSCSEPVPQGQVLAVVNGEDVTQRDLAAEAAVRADQVPGVVAELIDRRLLAEAARAQGIEQTPEYLAAMRRAREQLLVQGLGRQLAAKIPAPRPADIAAYIAGRPHAFAERAVVALDRADTTASMTLDSARLGPDVARDLLSKKPGDNFSYGGAQWRVRSSRPAALSGIAARDFAEQSIRSEQLTAKLEEIIASKRAIASISYNEALGGSVR